MFPRGCKSQRHDALNDRFQYELIYVSCRKTYKGKLRNVGLNGKQKGDDSKYKDNDHCCQCDLDTLY